MDVRRCWGRGRTYFPAKTRRHVAAMRMGQSRSETPIPDVQEHSQTGMKAGQGEQRTTLSYPRPPRIPSLALATSTEVYCWGRARSWRETLSVAREQLKAGAGWDPWGKASGTVNIRQKQAPLEKREAVRVTTVPRKPQTHLHIWPGALPLPSTHTANSLTAHFQV